MDWDDEYEPALTLRELLTMLAWRVVPYAVGILVMCIVVWIGCTLAARIENKGASSPWVCVIDSARLDLKNSRKGQ